jgi:nicotinate-nucleotide adenylyltransferase
MKVGLFFGSFNPIHMGHLILANVMATHTNLEQVWFVVSPQNPFKKNKSLLHEQDRYDMVTRAIAYHPHLSVTDIEFAMPKPSYTVDTLAHLSEKYPQHQFTLIIGEDNLTAFESWKNYQAILDYYGLYVYPRPGTATHNFANHPKVQFVKAPLLDISATFIRDCIKAGKPITYMVSEPVENMIKAKGFYQ